ncbi:MAG TPA: glycosyltransferase [Candidatus Polarisedimenticolaceae bacterium]|nr:glycosyltransferase [Candidatus Polarisedimenticolaceae bacterium]
MRMIVSGGGTSGHVSPVLATVDALRLIPDPPEILFIGTRDGVEAGLARAAGLPFKGIQGGKLRRLPGAGVAGNLRQWRHLAWNLRDSFLMVAGTFQALWIIGHYRPAVIFNKSGPPGLPIGVAAWVLGIPMILHEPDITPGLGTRVMGRWAVSIATGFPVNLYPARLQAKLIHTGTPVQPAILQGSKAAARRRFKLQDGVPVVLVVGGSQGAKALNTALMGCLPDLLKKMQILHITGGLDAERVEQEMVRRLHNVKEPIYLYRRETLLEASAMADAYAIADVVVARAGASTIAELAALAKPTVLVPNTEAAAHQVQNAKALEQAEAVIVTSNEPQELSRAIRSFIDSAEQRRRYAAAIAQFNAPEAADYLAHVLLAQGGRP